MSPNTGFGELICQAVEESGDFEARQALDGSQAQEALAELAADLLIVDGELGVEVIADLLALQRQGAPDARSVLIPAEQTEGDENFDSLSVDYPLPKPFYLPDLIEALQQSFGVSEIHEDKEEMAPIEAPQFFAIKKQMRKAPDWLQDADLAARHLMQLSLESSAQAALITHKDKVWAYSGELSQESVDQLALEVFAGLDYEGQSDLARFLHLQAEQNNYMLYATALGGHYALVMIFDTAIPFSKMRAQADFLAEALAKQPALELVAEGEQGGEPMEYEEPVEGDASELEDFLSEAGVAPLPEAPSTVENIEAGEDPSSSPPTSEDLVFTFALIPRMPDHQLDVGLRNQLATWLPQMCVAFGWRLESYEIRADYILWVVEIGSESSPQSVAEEMARQLSLRIFEELPRLARENPSGEFWAPKPLIRSGHVSQQSTIEQYISDTRASQGLSV